MLNKNVILEIAYDMRIWVNPDLVETLRGEDDGWVILELVSGKRFIVKGDIESVLKKLNGNT